MGHGSGDGGSGSVSGDGGGGSVSGDGGGGSGDGGGGGDGGRRGNSGLVVLSHHAKLRCGGDGQSTRSPIEDTKRRQGT